MFWVAFIRCLSENPVPHSKKSDPLDPEKSRPRIQEKERNDNSRVICFVTVHTRVNNLLMAHKTHYGFPQHTVCLFN